MKKFGLTLFMALFSLLASATGIEVTQGKTTYVNTSGKIGLVFNLDYAKWLAIPCTWSLLNS